MNGEPDKKWDIVKDSYMWIGHLSSFQMMLLCGLIFMSLALVCPGKKQPLIHKGMIPDAIYWLLGGTLIYAYVGQIVGQAVVYVLLAAGIYTMDTLQHLKDGLPPVSTLPVLLQAFIILLMMDMIQYWTHRMFHTRRWWDFHAIHHSSLNVDWLTAARFHPVNIIIHSTLVGTIVYMVGFSPDAWLVLAPFNAIYSPLVHANLNWTYGPFRHVLASPVFHRWHHTHPDEGGNKNFAPTFPFIDIMFGTYYDPRDKRPETFGVEGNPVTDNVFQQLAYPFFRKKKKKGDSYGQV